MTTVEITQDNFQDTIENNEIVVFDFWAPWCGPCRFFAPVFEKAAENNPDIVFAKVNTEDQQELAGAFNIQSIPTLMVFKEQVGIFSQAGALPEPALDELLSKIREVDMEEVRTELQKQSIAQAN